MHQSSGAKMHYSQVNEWRWAPHGRGEGSMAIDEGITIKKLEVFLAFMKYGSMTRVSESIGQSVVSVHRAVHSLEQSTRCPLFKLDGRKLIPLQAAYTFAEYAERALFECEEGLRKTREVAGFASPRLKIG